MADYVALELTDDVLVLDETEGLINTSLNLGWPDVRVVATARPQVDGTVDATKRFGARAVTVDVAAVDTTERTWKATLSRLARFLGAEQRPTLHLVVDGIDYWLGLAPDQSAAPFEHPNHAAAQLSFRAPDPFLYSVSKSVATSAYVTSPLGRTYPWTVPRIYPTSEITSGLVDADNTGSVAVWPIVTIWGPLASAFTLTNETTGDVFSMTSTTVDDTHRLVIDMRERTVRIDGDPNLPRFSAIDFPTSSWLRLVPGVNRLRFVTAAESFAMCEIQWADPYLWPGAIPEEAPA